MKIFNSSIEKNDLVCKYNLGDRDLTAFNDVLNSNPYGKFQIEPEKLGCVGHIQKRIGTRLCNRRKDQHDGSRLTGKGRLTERAVNRIQNYFGMAIRQAVANNSLTENIKVYQMIKKHSLYSLPLH